MRKDEKGMNQILVTEKIYVTPELKMKRKLYKIEFFLSIFLVCLLFSWYIYAQYDQNKSEEVSQEILAGINLGEEETQTDTTTISKKDNVLIVVLDETEEVKEEINVDDLVDEATRKGKGRIPEKHVASDGKEYYSVGIVEIPSINVKYPILSQTSDALLKISPCKFWGPELNEVGKYCIVVHNYRNRKFFSNVPTLEEGDTIDITDLSGRTITYEVYDKYEVDPEDVSPTSQLTGGKKEITLITCTNDNVHRVIVKAREVK